MENFRTIQGNNQMNITGYSQQNNILGKTISNQKPNMINNPFFNEMLAKLDETRMEFLIKKEPREVNEKLYYGYITEYSEYGNIPH